MIYFWFVKFNVIISYDAMSHVVFSGYMSPEYAMEGTFSIKSDIFSFGVLILEIVSGRRNSSFVHLDRTFNLIGYVSIVKFTTSFI